MDHFSLTEAIIASNARPAAALEISAPAAILSISCDLFTLSSPLEFYRRAENPYGQHDSAAVISILSNLGKQPKGRNFCQTAELT